MNELNLQDINALNGIIVALTEAGKHDQANTLFAIQAKLMNCLSGPTRLSFKKEVNVTNDKNVLVQVPKVVVTDWGLKVGDKLELKYEDGKVTINPAVRG